MNPQSDDLPHIDVPDLSAPEPYWRRELRRQDGWTDNAGLVADLGRRLISRPLHLQWRLSVAAYVRATVYAEDEYDAGAAIRAALYDHDTLIALSRCDQESVPPWRPLGTTTNLKLGAVHCESDDGRLWRSMTLMNATFVVGVTDAAWPGRHFEVDILTPPHERRLAAVEAVGVQIWQRRPIRRSWAPPMWA